MEFMLRGPHESNCFRGYFTPPATVPAGHHHERHNPQGVDLLSGISAAVCGSFQGLAGTPAHDSGGVFIVSTLLVFGGVAMAAGLIGERLNRSERGRKIMNRVAGTVFAGLALTLVTARQ